MEILNETVYDSGDLERFILWVRDQCHVLENERLKQNGGSPREPRKLPEKLRVGYYNQSPREDGEVHWTSLTGRWDQVNRLGIIRHTKLPLVAMEVIAREASDKDQRTLPREVVVCLLLKVSSMFGYWRSASSSLLEAVDQAPAIRYQWRADRKSAKAAKALADQQRAERLTQKIGWINRDIKRLEDKLREANTKLFKAKARLHKLTKGKQKMEATRG